MEFTKNSFEAFRNDVNTALEAIAAKYDVKIDTGKIKYGEVDFTMELKVEKSGNIDAGKVKFEQMCSMFGFTPEDYMVRFMLQGDEFELIGFKPGSPKNNCLFRKVKDGKSYHGNDQMVKRALAVKGVQRAELAQNKLPTDGRLRCKYCGKLSYSNDPDVLCPPCRKQFGHTMFSEL